MPDARAIELYNNSFEHCMAKEGFLLHFYEIFIGSSSEVREKFSNTDFRKQVRILRKSLYVLTMAAVGTAEAEAELRRLGHSHGKAGMNIDPSMYDLWLDCLMRAVKAYDPAWNPEVEKSWRAVLTPHIEKLKRYS